MKCQLGEHCESEATHSYIWPSQPVTFACEHHLNAMLKGADRSQLSVSEFVGAPEGGHFIIATGGGGGGGGGPVAEPANIATPPLFTETLVSGRKTLPSYAPRKKESD